MIEDGEAVSKGVEQAIDFELPDHQGKSWRLAENLARGPVLLVLYRGDW
jgi:peroxiredoxin